MQLSAGWRFPTPEDNDAEGENVIPDPLHKGFTHLRDVYFDVDSGYEGRFTVPVLYDKKQMTIVNNESADILRMLNTVVRILLLLSSLSRRSRGG
jgi:glutathionyl-hydroquinone reductase